MPSRNAYRDKLRGAGPEVKVKCRTVIQGCHDPDMSISDRSSPTPSRLAEYIIYEISPVTTGECRHRERGGISGRGMFQQHSFKASRSLAVIQSS